MKGDQSKSQFEVFEEIDEYSHSLDREALLEMELNKVKNSYSSIYYIQNMLKCFYQDDLFEQIVQSISDDVLQKLDSKKEEQQKLQEIFNLTLEGQKQQSNSLQKMIAEKRSREAIDPEQLQLKIAQLQQKLEKQNRDYYMELDVYRSQLRKSQAGGISTKDLRDLKKEVLEVRLFDECDQIPEEQLKLMNLKITDLQNLYAKQVYMQLQAFKQYCLIDLDLDEIVSALPALEADPHKLWEIMEKHYRANFFDGVILKKYGQLFEDKNEGEFVDHLKIVRDEVKQESQLLAMHYEEVIKQLKAEYNDKVIEARESKAAYLGAYKKAFDEADEQARNQYEERERLIFSRWEQERAGLMEEMAEQEKQYAHFEVQLAQEKFKGFVFRWTTFNKINKMKKFDKDSYDFIKANLEVQEWLKVDIDFRVEAANKVMKEKVRKAQDLYYQTLNDRQLYDDMNEFQ